jgi:hypothetical protein
MSNDEQQRQGGSRDHPCNGQEKPWRVRQEQGAEGHQRQGATQLQQSGTPARLADLKTRKRQRKERKEQTQKGNKPNNEQKVR